MSQPLISSPSGDTRTKIFNRRSQAVTLGTIRQLATTDTCRRCNFVSTTDFQSFWRHANEDIQSSESGCHFGHYKAASHNRYLSAMHAAKLTATTGDPLARWGKGLTVLLEKIFGNIYIDKMCAICLLEVDYNWLNKFVFAK